VSGPGSTSAGRRCSRGGSAGGTPSLDCRPARDSSQRCCAPAAGADAVASRQRACGSQVIIFACAVRTTPNFKFWYTQCTILLVDRTKDRRNCWMTRSSGRCNVCQLAGRLTEHCIVSCVCAFDPWTACLAIAQHPAALISASNQRLCTHAGAAPPRVAVILGELFRLNAPVNEGGLRVTALLRQTHCRLALRLLLRRTGGDDTAVLLTADDNDDAGAPYACAVPLADYCKGGIACQRNFDPNTHA